jgi:hypothetical protein
MEQAITSRNFLVVVVERNDIENMCEFKNRFGLVDGLDQSPHCIGFDKQLHEAPSFDLGVFA